MIQTGCFESAAVELALAAAVSAFPSAGNENEKFAAYESAKISILK